MFTQNEKCAATSGTISPVGDPKGDGMPYLEGRLRKHTPAESEGEHTGYVLEIEVDMSAVKDAEGLVDEGVAITGGVEIVDYPERGKVLLFRATSAAGMDETLE